MKLLIYLGFTFILVACGNKLSTSNSSKLNVQQSSTVSCLCNTSYHPVCGLADNKSYENACLAKCFGNSNYSDGNCTCKEDVTVCGSDGVNYTECEAKKAKVTIIKYSPCESSEL